MRKLFITLSVFSIVFGLCAQTPLPLPKGYQRLDAFPIDSTTVYTNLVDLQHYASNNASAYPGQILTLSDGVNPATGYIINFDKTTSELGEDISHLVSTNDTGRQLDWTGADIRINTATAEDNPVTFKQLAGALGSLDMDNINLLQYGECEDVSDISLISFIHTPESISLGDKIIVFDSTDHVYSFDGSTYTEINNLSNLTVTLTRFSVSTISTNLFLMGGIYDDGFGGLLYSNVFKFDGVDWAEVASLPDNRGSGDSAALHNNIYYFGGADQTILYTNVFKFDGVDWSEANSLPVQISSIRAKTFNDLIYLTGNSTNMYVFDGTNYTLINSLPENLYDVEFGIVDNSLFCFGGHISYNAKTNVYRLNSETNWDSVSSLLVGSYNLTASELDSDVYLFGGSGNNGINSNVYRYSIGQSFGFDADNLFKILENGEIKIPSYSEGAGLDTNTSYTFADGTVQSFDDVIIRDGLTLGGVERTEWPSGVASDSGQQFIMYSTNAFTLTNSMTQKVTFDTLKTNTIGAVYSDGVFTLPEGLYALDSTLTYRYYVGKSNTIVGSKLRKNETWRFLSGTYATKATYTWGYGDMGGSLIFLNESETNLFYITSFHDSGVSATNRAGEEYFNLYITKLEPVIAPGTVTTWSNLTYTSVNPTGYQYDTNTFVTHDASYHPFSITNVIGNPENLVGVQAEIAIQSGNSVNVGGIAGSTNFTYQRLLGRASYTNSTMVYSGFIETSDTTLYYLSNLSGENRQFGLCIQGYWTAPSITAGGTGGDSVAYVTPYSLVYAPTVTVARADGPWQAFAPTNAVQINIEDATTNTIDSIRLDLRAGTNAVTFGTNNVTYSSFTNSTTGTTSILYDSRWGESNWNAWELENP